MTLHTLEERTAYAYRVRVSNGTNSSNPAHPTEWERTTGIKWCSGGDYEVPGDPFGEGYAAGDLWCPLLPEDASAEKQVAMCEAVCGAANATACAGFTLYPGAGTQKAQCCFRTDTEQKPADPASTAVCYEKKVQGNHCLHIGSEWSEWLAFKSLYSSGVTKLALYADMGVFVAEGTGPPAVEALPHRGAHNVGNLVDDLSDGLIDFAIHSGDHAYAFEKEGGNRGDGYMDGYSDFLAHAPWAPGWGNHEYLEEDRGNRLANITAGMIAERQHAAAATTRMFYSVEIGLLHLLHLDLSPYWCRFDGCVGVDTCGFPDAWVKAPSASNPDTRYDFEGYRAAIMAYARADLAAVDRSKTPWVMVTAHFPLYETYDDGHRENLASARAKPDGGARGAGGASPAEGAGAGAGAGAGGSEGPGGGSARLMPSKAQALADFEPLLAEYAVDVYFAGHDHNYETTWPVYNNTPFQTNYSNPEAPIHILSGSAGPPEWDYFTAHGEAWTREPRILMNTYSRLVLLNASVARFEQVANDNGTVVDTFSIVQTRRNRSAPFRCFFD